MGERFLPRCSDDASMTEDSAFSPPSESQLTRAEAELGDREQQLLDQVRQAQQETRQLESLLASLKDRLESSILSGAADVLGELQDAALPGLEVQGDRARALELRRQALAVRKEVAETLEQRVQAHAEARTKLRERLTKRSEWLEAEEQAERTRQERERREAEAQARAEAAARAQAAEPPTPPPAEDGADAGPHTGQEPALADTFISPSPGQAPPLPPQARNLGRQRDRFALQAAIDLRSDSNFFTGFSTNLSEGGVFLATYQELSPGTEVELTLTLPGHPALAVKGTVRWIRELNERVPELTPGLGIQFTGLAADQLEAIRTFVQSREPLFFPE